MVAPSVLPGRAFQRSDRVSRLLFHYRASDLSIKPLTGEIPTLTRASRGTMVDGTGIGRLAVHSQPRFDMLDLEGAGFRKNAGLVFEGARTQLVTDPENLANWTQQGLVGLTANQPDPYGGLGGYVLDSNTPAVGDARFLLVAFTGNGTKALVAHAKADASTVQSDLLVFDQTATIERCRLRLTWTAGVPVASIQNGSGTIHSVEPMVDGWYAIYFSVDNIIATNTNRIYLYPDPTGSGAHTVFFGVNAWDAVFPSSYQPPGISPRVAELMQVPIAFGPMGLTVSWGISRPRLLAGASGISGIFDLGDGATNHVWVYLDKSVNTYLGSVEAGGAQGVTPAIPAGALLEGALHLDLLETGAARVRMDTGGGYGGFSGATASALAAWANNRIQLGGIFNTTASLWSALAYLKIAADGVPLAQMRQLL